MAALTAVTKTRNKIVSMIILSGDFLRAEQRRMHDPLYIRVPRYPLGH
jgi:hypothetical protein